jgi:hypothetical protein
VVGLGFSQPTTCVITGPPGNHSLNQGMIHPIGHFVNPPMPKLGKLHKVFENLFNLMRWFFMHMLR